ncbi:MAG TPA: aspartyl protease family protein [Candidatus Cybelea sp.]|nr:aspartyl protease family protein [Candidatus Cybelea sp.]
MRLTRLALGSFGALVGLALSLVGGSASPAPTSTKTLLDGLRRAMLSESLASIVSLHTVGSIEIVGIRGRAQEWDDLRGVRFTTAQNAGALSGASGWDGKVAWSQDYGGLVTIDGGTAGQLQAIDQAYLANLRYLRPDAGGATVIYAGARTADDKSYDVLSVTPPHGSEIDLWIDPRTRLIAREAETIGTTTATTTLSSYRRVDGILYPFESATETSTGNAFTEHVSSLEVNTDVAERMRVPGQNVHDAAISGATTTVPLQIVNNHVYVPGVMLDGRGPYTFVLDSGGDYIVTPEVAAALHAASAGGVQLEGAGSETEGAAFAHLTSIEIGNATIRNQYTLVLPIATGFGVAEGLKIDGMLGYQFLARFLTTIDYANAKLTLTTPGVGPAAIAGAAAIPFYIDGRIPRISIQVDGVTTSAEVDTGNRAGIEFSAPFLTAHPQIAGLARTPPGVVGFGVGGPVLARLGRVPSLQIGPYSVTNAIASFGDQSSGAFADPFNPANLGGSILRRFDVTFDYAHQQLLLARNASFGDPFAYDRSGLFLIDSNGAYTILGVLSGTAAAAAGLAKGDVILTINGTSAPSQSLAALRTLLSGPAGTTVQLHIRGPAGRERDATLKLADYV